MSELSDLTVFISLSAYEGGCRQLDVRR
jgi:hypothetical protein